MSADELCNLFHNFHSPFTSHLHHNISLNFPSITSAHVATPITIAISTFTIPSMGRVLYTYTYIYIYIYTREEN